MGASCLLGECDAGRSDIHGARKTEDRPRHRCCVCSQTTRTDPLWLWLLIWHLPIQIFWSHMGSIANLTTVQISVECPELHVNTSDFYNIFVSETVCYMWHPCKWYSMKSVQCENKFQN